MSIGTTPRTLRVLYHILCHNKFFVQGACISYFSQGDVIKKLIKVLAVVGLVVVALLLALPTLLHKAGLHPEYTSEPVALPGKRALIITTSHAVLHALGETDGEATGVFASELTHPYYTFMDAGMDVDVASIAGGAIPVDPSSFYYMIRSPEDERYLQDSVLQAKVEHSLPIDTVDISDYDIVFLAGGWGAAYDLAQSPVLAEKVSEAFYGEREAVIGGVCHGVLGLVSAKDREGNLLVAGRRMTGVTDKQVTELGIAITPRHPETELRKAGALYESKSAFRDMLATHVTVDEEQRFVTGQNQNSGLETAHKMMAIIAVRD